jgi:hypothetical protein
VVRSVNVGQDWIEISFEVLAEALEVLINRFGIDIAKFKVKIQHMI